MLDVLLQVNLLGQIIETAINPHSHITALARLIEQFNVLALSSTDNRGEKLELRPLRQCHNLIDHLIDCLTPDLPSTLRAMRDTDSRIQKTHIIVDLRDRSDCRSRVAVRRLLIN